MRSAMIAALILVTTVPATGRQHCAAGICAGSLNPMSGLPRAIAGGAAGSPGAELGLSPYALRTDALGVTRDPAGNILPTDSLGLTRTRDGRLCTRDASGLLQCR